MARATRTTMAGSAINHHAGRHARRRGPSPPQHARVRRPIRGTLAHAMQRGGRECVRDERTGISGAARQPRGRNRGNPMPMRHGQLIKLQATCRGRAHHEPAAGAAFRFPQMTI